MRPIPETLRIRVLGQAELNHVVPNGHLAAHFLKRAWKVTPRQTLISMDGIEGGPRRGFYVRRHSVYLAAGAAAAGPAVGPFVFKRTRIK